MGSSRGDLSLERETSARFEICLAMGSSRVDLSLERRASARLEIDLAMGSSRVDLSLERRASARLEIDLAMGSSPEPGTPDIGEARDRSRVDLRPRTRGVTQGSM